MSWPFRKNNNAEERRTLVDWPRLIYRFHRYLPSTSEFSLPLTHLPFLRPRLSPVAFFSVLRSFSVALITLRTYLQEFRMRDTLHPSGALAQNVRDRVPALRLVDLLHGSLVEQEDRDLLQARGKLSVLVVREL